MQNTIPIIMIRIVKMVQGGVVVEAVFQKIGFWVQINQFVSEVVKSQTIIR